MVVPVGSRSEQELMKLTRTEHGYSMKTLGACRFVPLIGEGAWSEHDDDDP
jgi:protein-L-isoaspartate O-methyltransferase